jgi:hypothetical protein
MLSENYKIVPVAKEIDISSTVYSDSINMKDFHSATFMFILNTLGGASSVLTVCSGATDAACTSALTFNYAFGGAALGTAVAGSTSSCDVLAAWTSATTLTLTYGTYSNFMLVVEVNAAAMDIANAEEWLTCKFTTTPVLPVM